MHDYNAIPYHIIDIIKYKFLLIYKKGDSFDEAIYGEYIFKEKGGQLLFVDKYIETLLNEKDILTKYNDIW